MFVALDYESLLAAIDFDQELNLKFKHCSQYDFFSFCLYIWCLRGVVFLNKVGRKSYYISDTIYVASYINFIFIFYYLCIILYQVRLMDEAGYELGNLDATLILQRPKLSPHKETIRTNLSLLLGADPSVVNLKAKTHEKVDSLGENRSIAAHTVVLLMKK